MLLKNKISKDINENEINELHSLTTKFWLRIPDSGSTLHVSKYQDKKEKRVKKGCLIFPTNFSHSFKNLVKNVLR